MISDQLYKYYLKHSWNTDTLLAECHDDIFHVKIGGQIYLIEFKDFNEIAQLTKPIGSFFVANLANENFYIFVIAKVGRGNNGAIRAWTTLEIIKKIPDVAQKILEAY